MGGQGRARTAGSRPDTIPTAVSGTTPFADEVGAGRLGALTANHHRRGAGGMFGDFFAESPDPRVLRTESGPMGRAARTRRPCALPTDRVPIQAASGERRQAGRHASMDLGTGQGNELL